MTKNKYPKTFQLEVENGYYYTVFIFYTEKQMYSFRRSLVGKGYYDAGEDDYSALASMKNYTTEDMELGVVLFTKRTCRKAGIVTHEMFHAVAFYWEVFFPDEFINGRNESFAGVLGQTTSRYWTEFWKLGIIDA